MGGLHTNEVYLAVTGVLDEHGIPHSVEHGGKHWKLFFEVNGRRFVEPIAGTPSDRRSSLNARAKVRRLIETASSQTVRSPDMASVKIIDTDVAVLEYRGQRVVTFEAVDNIHQRPDGTASRTFHQNRSRFVEGEDFTSLTASQNNEIRSFGIVIPNRGLIVLTRRGYLKLTKPLSDDRAWAVQGEMVERYFAFAEITKVLSSDAPDQDKVERSFGIAKKTISKVTSIEKDVSDLKAGSELALEAITNLQRRVEQIAAAPVAATFDLSTTITSDDIIEMAGIKAGDRVRGTPSMVTHAMLDFCGGVGCLRTPREYNRSRPWRFPRQKASEWLFGASLGGECIRSQIHTQKAKLAAKGRKTGQAALQLVGGAIPS